MVDMHTVGLHLRLQADISALGVDCPVEFGDVRGLHQPHRGGRPLLHRPRELEFPLLLQSLLGLENFIYIGVHGGK